jgi:hypothetical protein
MESTRAAGRFDRVTVGELCGVHVSHLFLTDQFFFGKTHSTPLPDMQVQA